MSRYKGRPTTRSLAARYPHHVVIRIPELGLGVRTDAICTKVREIAGEDHADWPITQGLDCRAVYGFRAPEHAEAFRAWLAGTFPELEIG